MGKPDIYQSGYFEDRRRFADLVNGVLYEGRQLVKPEELQELDTELVSIRGNGKKTVRDKVRLWKGLAIAVISLENQNYIDYRMVVRNMLTESMAYEKQCKRLERKHRGEKGLGNDAFLSGMKKEEKLFPVITIVVYYGAGKPWDGEKELYGLLEMEGREAYIKPYISNYKLNLFDINDYDSFGQFHTELESLFEFLRYSGEKELLEEKLKQNRARYSHLDKETVRLLSRLANVEKLEHIQEKEKGGIDMCKAWEDQKLEGIMEGRKEGRMELIRRIMENRKMSLEEVLEMTGMSEEERISCREEIAIG